MPDTPLNQPDDFQSAAPQAPEPAPDTTPGTPDTPDNGTPGTPETPSNLPPPEPPADTADNPAPPVPVSGSGGSHKGRRTGLIILLLLVVVAAVAAAYVVKTHETKPVTVLKRDIPYLTFSSDTTANLTQLYPTETVDTDTSNELNPQLFEGLVQYQQTTKIAPLLATSWSNPNDTTWVFNLHKGVKFHSGKMMTATDVKYSLDYAVAHQSDNGTNTNLTLASTIKQVDVVNPYQVKITTTGPDPVLLNRLAYLFVLDSKAKIGNPNAGTGPYIVKPGTTPTADTLDLTAFNNYWGGHIYTRAVHIHLVTDANQLAADTAKGQFDIAGDFTKEQLGKIKNYRPITIHDLGITFLGLNTEKAGSPLQSLAARQAITYALNIPAILKAGNLSGTQAGQLVPPAIPGHDPSIHDTLYDPAKAKQLLSTVPNAAAPLTLSYPTGDEGQLGEIAKDLNAVGFNVKLSGVKDIGDLVNLGLGGQTDMFYVTYSSTTLDGLDILNSILVDNKEYDSPTIDKLADQASSTLDPAARITLLQKIARQVAADVPDVPLYTQTRTVALTKPYNVQVDIPSVTPGIYFRQIYQN
jgi:peptide/nickel transport system substrate-binding protein